LPSSARKDSDVDVRTIKDALSTRRLRLLRLQNQLGDSTRRRVRRSQYLDCQLPTGDCGLLKAAYSEQRSAWPAPGTLASTILIFFRQGFHFQNRLPVLQRQRG